MFTILKFPLEHDVVFSTSDAQTYLDVTNWFLIGEVNESVSTRPFLFPLLLLFFTKVAGAIGVWIMNVVCWFISVNLIFLSLKKLTKTLLLPCIGVLIFLANISVIALTFHALTEVITICILSALIYFIVKNRNEFYTPKFFSVVILFFSVLTTIKPVFSLPLMVLIFAVLPLFYFKKVIRNWKNILVLILCLSPILIQLTLMKIEFNETKISLISSKTIKKYIVTQAIQELDSIKRPEAMKKAEDLNSDEQAAFISNNLSLFGKLFKKNLEDNITGKSTFLGFPKEYKSQKLANYMSLYNRITLKIHLIFLGLIAIMFFFMIKQKQISLLVIISAAFILLSYFILTTGISFFQGDRLTLPSIAIWSILYPFTVFFLCNQFLVKKNKVVID